MDLKGKKVVVTGGAVRVGAALVQAFSAKGAFLVIHCRHSLAEGKRLLEKIGGEKKGHRLVQMDLSDPEEVTARGGELLAGADLLINNASTYVRRRMEEEAPAESFLQWNVNFHAPVLLMQMFARQAQEGSAVINMLDQGICRSDENSFSYALSKKALAEATRSAALQLAPRIRVNGIAPGPVLPPVGLEHSRMEKTLQFVPLQKPVSLSDLTSGAIFLAENESLTGEILFMDCGQSLCPLSPHPPKGL